MVPPRNRVLEEIKKSGRKTTKSTKGVKSGQKKTEAAGPSTSASAAVSSSDKGSSFVLTSKEQQGVLDTFVRAFPLLLGHGVDQEPLLRTLQEVKSHLYKRDFLAAFGQESYLEAYAARWSPSRAWGYSTIFGEVLVEAEKKRYLLNTDDEIVSAISLGGGAGAELVALATVAATWNKRVDVSEQKELDQPSETVAAATTRRLRFDVKLVDIAAWQDVASMLYEALKNPPVLSVYASTAAKAANRAVIQPDELSYTFSQTDVLQLSFDALSQLLEGAKLVTIMFTLNELYSTSLSATQSLLLSLTSLTAPGTLLLVVDSPSSYSQVKLAGREKTYPMQYLLDLTLLSMAKGTETESSASSILSTQPDLSQLPEDGRTPIAETSEPMWEKIMEDQSRWFRVPQSLRYPLELENMRCQIHLFLRK